MDEIDGVPQVNFGAERAKILILDRTFDLAGPLTHTYSVLSLVEEMMAGRPGCLISEQQKDHLQTCFNEDDPYWQKYKSNNAGAALVDLEN